MPTAPRKPDTELVAVDWPHASGAGEIAAVLARAGLHPEYDNRALNAAKGHTRSILWKDVADDASYLITSEWSDEQAFQDFIHSQAFRDVTTWGKEQILSGRPQHKIYKH